MDLRVDLKVDLKVLEIVELVVATTHLQRPDCSIAFFLPHMNTHKEVGKVVTSVSMAASRGAVVRAV